MAGLCLGTVQFGMKYGINNKLGQPTWEESFHMLDIALDKGITILDTARAYGQAEEILGVYIKENCIQNRVKVISKLCPNIIEGKETDIAGVIRRELENTLSLLNISQLDGYLLHTPEYIYNKKILSALVQMKREKLVNNLGISIYNIKEGEEAIKTGIVDYIQLPYNIFDQRGIQTGFIKKAKQQEITIFTRSTFLQGLFMMDIEKIPNYLKSAIPYLNMFEKLIRKYNLQKTEALISFVTQEPDIDYLVLGVDKPSQLLEDIDINMNNSVPNEFIEEIKKQFQNINNSIIIPSLWANGKK